jgi:hypothetical protein
MIVPYTPPLLANVEALPAADPIPSICTSYTILPNTEETNPPTQGALLHAWLGCHDTSAFPLRFPYRILLHLRISPVQLCPWPLFFFPVGPPDTTNHHHPQPPPPTLRLLRQRLSEC